MEQNQSFSVESMLKCCDFKWGGGGINVIMPLIFPQGPFWTSPLNMYSILSYYNIIMTTDAINDYQNNPLNCNVTIPNYETLCTAGIFATYPQSFLTLGIGFFDQVSYGVLI